MNTGLTTSTLGDLGVLLTVVGVEQAVGDVEQDPLLGDEAADVVQPGLGVERVDEAIHPVEERAGPEIGQAAGPLLGLGQQIVAVEGG